MLEREHLMTTSFNIDFRNQIDQHQHIDLLTRRSRLFTGYLCNIKCKFCFYKDSKYVDIRDEISQQLTAGHDYGIKDWDISGGEPTILPYWFILLEYMKTELEADRIAVITNGYKFADKQFLKDSIDSGLNEVLFSLHGSCEEVHDGMTDIKGSYAKIMEAIENAMELGIFVRINTVVSKDNYLDVPKIAEKVNQIMPKCFNFLPFRLENTASEDNMVSFVDSMRYVKEAIDILDKSIRINVRYVPFCVMQGYEKYLCMYKQKMFDHYEWSEHIIHWSEKIRHGTPVSKLELAGNKWDIETKAIQNTLSSITIQPFVCLKCSCLYICDCIWKTYANKWGIKEFTSIDGDRIKDILHFKGKLDGNLRSRA